MEFKCEQGKLAEFLAPIARIAHNRVVESAQGMLISLEGNRLTARATNLEVSIESSIEVEGVKEGKALIADAALFARFISRLNKTTVHVVTKDNKLYVKGGKSRAQIALSTEDFPGSWVPLENAVVWNMSQSTFKEMIRKTIICVGAADTMPVLGGIHFSSMSGKVFAAATDRNRLSCAWSNEQTPDTSFTISGSTAKELDNWINSSEDEVTFCITDKAVDVILPDTRIRCQLLEGDFPDYKRVIPSSTKHLVTIDRQEFLSSVERASLLGKQNAVIRLTFDNGSVRIQSESKETGRFQEDLPVEHHGDVPMDVMAYSSRYLIDALKNLEGESITFGFNEPLNATKFEEGNLIQVVMPVRVH